MKSFSEAQRDFPGAAPRPTDSRPIVVRLKDGQSIVAQLWKVHSPSLEVVAAAVLGGASLTLILTIALGRTYLGYGVETDFFGGFVHEAERILRGERLHLNFHPPFYAFVLAGFGWVLGSWVAAGLMISAIAAAAVLVTNFTLYRRLHRYAGWGALLALTTSPPFLIYSAQAGSDVFFLALFSGTLLVALQAFTGGGRWQFMVLGGLIGLTMLTRMNGVTMAVLLATPLLVHTSWRARLRLGSWTALGLITVLGVWGLAASHTGSPFWPVNNHVNLAMTYYASGDRRTSESFHEVDGRFASTREVLLHDPVRVMKVYVRDAVATAEGVSTGNHLLAVPLAMFAMPGLVLLLVHGSHRRFVVLLFLVGLASVALLNLKTFETRYYLLLVPLLGAGTGACAAWLTREMPPWGRRSLIAVGFFVAIVSPFYTVREMRARLYANEAELSEVIPLARAAIRPGDITLARKPHLGFYTGSLAAGLPSDARSPEELREHVRAVSSQRTFIYFGSLEQRARPGLSFLASPDSAPPWLQPVARSSQPGGWVLYRAIP